MMRHLLLALMLSAGCALHGATVSRPGATLDCTARRGVSGAPAIDPACRRLGAVALGMSRAEVEEKLGPADLEVSGPADCTNAAYVLNRGILDPRGAVEAVATHRLHASTLRLIYRSGHVAAVEADGGAAAEAFGFGPVHVGAGAEAVRHALGRAEVLSDQVWSYRPLLVLFDDEGRKVEALAVTEGNALACLLPATFEVSCDAGTGAPLRVTIVRPPGDAIRLHDEKEWPGTILRLPRACSAGGSAPRQGR